MAVSQAGREGAGHVPWIALGDMGASLGNGAAAAAREGDTARLCLEDGMEGSWAEDESPGVSLFG